MTPRFLAPTLLLLVVLASCAGSQGDAPSPEAATLTKVGDPAPELRVTTLDGATFDLAEQRGKVVLLSFWATWCPPCRQELPALRDQVHARWGDRDDFELVSVSREEDPETVTRFLAQADYRWTFAVDPDRSNYARYAEAHIPRTYVVGRDGRIVLQSVGFEAKEFAHLVATVEAQLAGAGE